MGTKELRGRDVWQDYSGANAGIAERGFYEVFDKHLVGSDFWIDAKPKEFKRIYVDQPLSDHVISQIYTPDEPIKNHGITPDYAIRNRVTGKTLYVEVKRQDGWVEGKPRSAGRGNAHERSCKYFTPGLLDVLHEESGIARPNLPFWTVFIGDITRDPCRVREITLWYGNHRNHFFMWRDLKNADPIVAHFETHLKQLLL
ncbi:MAG: restriction endonuclease [Rhodospirillaceae bacterium]|nr:restriction endonuclease [Rhodospirillaceae bacterium]|tara:strand:- start:416 stop:1015 length:600 start_codon:yes stop_codon:yes gene_type:complete